MAKRSPSEETPPPLNLDPVSEWRAWQALSVYFTIQVNRQIRRRWLLEQKIMENKPVTQRFRSFIFLEPVPTLHKPLILPSNTNITATESESEGERRYINHIQNSKYNPYNKSALEDLKIKVRLLHARVEKGKELASEIERRMQDPRIQFPTHFCHTCVMDGDCADVLLTKCGHRVCRTCLSFGVDENGIYECSICFAPTEFVTRSPLGPQRSCSEHISSVSKRFMSRGKSPSWSPLAFQG